MLRHSLSSVLASLLLLACSPLDQPQDVKPKLSDPSPPRPSSKTPTSEPVDLEAEPVALEPIAPPGEHSFSVLDLLEVDRVSSPTISPDGTLVAYVLRETDMKANKGRTSLWLQPIAGGEPTRIDAHPKGASQPRWSPDGKHLYFVSSRAGTSQVFRRAITGGSAGPVEQITELPVAVSNLLLAPDGKHLAISAELDPACADLQCSVERSEAVEADPATGVVYDHMFVRHWDTWKDHRRSMLLVTATQPRSPVTIVSRGLAADVPSKPFGGAEEWAFTPDGKGIVFAARDAGPSEPWSTNFDLFHAPLDGSTAPVRLTQNPAWDTHPRFSSDGKQLVYLAMARPGYEADRFALTTLSWTGAGVEGEPRAVTGTWDRSIGHFELGPAHAYATAQELGHTRLFAIDLASGTATALVESGTVGELSLGAEQLVLTRHDLRHPAELHTLALDRVLSGAEAEPKPLSHHNDALMARVRLGEAEQFSFPGWNGETVHGWVTKPVDFDPSKTYPVAFLIHGGPQGSFGDQFHFRWNPQTYAGAGWATVMIDFHGSTGYGQAFTDSIGGDWGGKPLEDLQKGLAYAIEHYQWLDGERVCALGASYGGFMINWIAGHWPDRFRCLVNHDGIFDARMMYYATEELWFPEWEHGAPEFADPRAYARFNPVDHVSKWQTPMLVVHGSLDYRVPVEQGLATFTALQRRGIPSRFLHFPDENHWVLSPANSKQWHDEVLRWLAEHG